LSATATSRAPASGDAVADRADAVLVGDGRAGDRLAVTAGEAARGESPSDVQPVTTTARQSPTHTRIAAP
jgi:hypothetical protein